MKKVYIDDPEVGPDASTSHPRFNEVMSEEFYLDCLDEFLPFGNDYGADTLYNLEDWYRDTKGKENILTFMYDYIDGLGFKYPCEGCIKLLDMKQLNVLLKEDEFFVDCMDKAIIATVFGQLKIAGRIDRKLKDLGRNYHGSLRTFFWRACRESHLNQQPQLYTHRISLRIGCAVNDCFLLRLDRIFTGGHR